MLIYNDGLNESFSVAGETQEALEKAIDAGEIQGSDGAFKLNDCLDGAGNLGLDGAAYRAAATFCFGRPFTVFFP